MNELSIIIPAYNEEESLPLFLPNLIQYCQTHKHQLIITNDGSKDNTKSILESYANKGALQLINHKVNKGYGGALKSALKISQSKYTISIDADGQHKLEDVGNLLKIIQKTDADMVVGKRPNSASNWYRKLGKKIIRNIAKMLMNITIDDLNSGMKIYNTQLAQNYLKLYPDGMAFSDVIALVFISQRHLVMEEPIGIENRKGGTSTIGTQTALDTIKEIINIVVLFNPMRVFLPITLFCIGFGVVWGLPIMLKGNGLSVGALFAFLSGVLFFFLGLIAEQLALIRKNSIE